MTPPKSQKKSPARPFTGRDDPRNGRGPKPGSPNAGRPASWIRQRARESLAERLHIADEIADGTATKRVGKKRYGPSFGDRIKALNLLKEIGLPNQLEIAPMDIPILTVQREP